MFAVGSEPLTRVQGFALGGLSRLQSAVALTKIWGLLGQARRFKFSVFRRHRRVRTDDPADVSLMRKALALAKEAASLGEVPVGALVAKDGRVLSQAFNLRETLNDPTAHAERLALTLAGRVLNSWRISGYTLYVTLEPCVMCAGAIVLSRIDRVVYGASDPKAGACQSLYRLTSDLRLNHRPVVLGGVLSEECSDVLRSFFQDRRRV